jgi:hypothetical protein
MVVTISPPPPILHHPGQMREPAELADNGRQCCRHDGLVERREQQCQKKRAENRAKRRSMLGGRHHFLITVALAPRANQQPAQADRDASSG